MLMVLTDRRDDLQIKLQEETCIILNNIEMAKVLLDEVTKIKTRYTNIYCSNEFNQQLA